MGSTCRLGRQRSSRRLRAADTPSQPPTWSGGGDRPPSHPGAPLPHHRGWPVSLRPHQSNSVPGTEELSRPLPPHRFFINFPGQEGGIRDTNPISAPSPDSPAPQPRGPPGDREERPSSLGPSKPTRVPLPRAPLTSSLGHLQRPAPREPLRPMVLEAGPAGGAGVTPAAGGCGRAPAAPCRGGGGVGKGGPGAGGTERGDGGDRAPRFAGRKQEERAGLDPET